VPVGLSNYVHALSALEDNVLRKVLHLRGRKYQDMAEHMLRDVMKFYLPNIIRVFK
jgi:hypothetical protein